MHQRPSPRLEPVARGAAPYCGVRLIRRTNQPLPCPAAGSDFTHDAIDPSFLSTQSTSAIEHPPCLINQLSFVRGWEVDQSPVTKTVIFDTPGSGEVLTHTLEWIKKRRRRVCIGHKRPCHQPWRPLNEALTYVAPASSANTF